MLLLHIPGYYDRAAKRLERLEDYWRDLAFLGLTEELRFAGRRKVEVRQLTLRMFVQLCAVRSPFLVGGKVGPEHVAQILWRLSPIYDTRLANPEARKAFVESVADLGYHSAVRTISRFVDRMLIDKPPIPESKSKGKAKPDTSFAASVIHTMAISYGWNDELILDQPIPRLFQYMRKITRYNDPEVLTFNPLVDKYKARIMKEYFIARKAAQQNAAL